MAAEREIETTLGEKEFWCNRSATCNEIHMQLDVKAVTKILQLLG